MPSRVRIAAIVGFAGGVVGFAAGAAAQDSVSNAGTGLPGDALSPYAADAQRTNYVVDLATLTTSWGNEFGIAPIIKVSKAESGFFTNLGSASTISQDLRSGAAFPASSYALWEDQPGAGVNPQFNDEPGSIDPPAEGTVFGTAITSFGGENNTVTTAVAGFDPAEPDRLYVSRVVSAVNGADNTENTAAFGIGAADADGHTHFRADDFGASGPNPVAGQNIFRVDALARSGSSLNIIGGAGGSDGAATDGLITGSGVTHSTPSAIPASIAGRPVYAGANYNDQYVYESAPGGTSTSGAHISMAPNSVSQRGTVSFSPATFSAFPGSVGTFSLIGQGGDDEDTREIIFWGVDADGNITGVGEAALPQVSGVSEISDPIDPFTIGFESGDTIQLGEFDGYHSQAPFNGPNGQTHVGSLPSGDGLVVGQTYNGTMGNADPFTSVVAGTFDPANPGDVDWSLVSWVGGSGDPFDGKPIKDGPGGEVVGNLTALFNVTGGDPTGPSVSNSFIDAKGNIWFIHAIVQEQKDPDTGEPFNDFDSGLIRAVYDESAGGWELELVLELGQVFEGPNSGVPYQITFMGIADSNSISSSTLGSNSGNQNGWNNIDASGLEQDDPRSLGGLVVTAEITYDADGDGDFEDPTSTGGNPDSNDESYDAQLLITNILPAEDDCPPDLNDDGQITSADFLQFIDLFAAGDPDAEFDGEPGITSGDFLAFIDAFAAGCP